MLMQLQEGQAQLLLVPGRSHSAVALQQLHPTHHGLDRELLLLAGAQLLQLLAVDVWAVQQLVKVVAWCSSEVWLLALQLELQRVTRRQRCVRHCRRGLHSNKQPRRAGDRL